MRLPSSTIRSEFRAAAWLLGAGLCAGSALGAGTASPAASSQPFPTVLDIQYGNRAARASLRVDLQESDVYVEMTGRPPRMDSVPAMAAVPAAPVREAPAAEGGVRSVSSRTDSIITRSIVEAAGRSEPRDSVTPRVVGAIRKAQEAFYRSDYADAQRLAQSSLEEHPTAEGYALSGSIAWVQKDYSTAGRQWRAALAMNPEYPGIPAMLQKLSGKETP